MVIGIDASRANRGHKSGTEWYAYYLIQEFSKLDKDNRYILYSDEPLGAELSDLTREAEEGAAAGVDRRGYQAVRSPHNNFQAKILKWPFNFFWTQGRLSLEMLFKPPDVLFVPSHTLPFIHPKNSIITIHDIGFARYKKLYLQDEMGPANSLFRKLINFLVKIFTGGKYGANLMDYYQWSTLFGLKHARKVITVSNFSKKEILDVYSQYKISPQAEKIKVIYNGYSDLFCRRISDQERLEAVLKKYGIEPPFIFYVGRIDNKKNISSLIQAFALLKEKEKQLNHKLILVGDASFGYDEVKYQIEEFKLDNEVITTGWAAEADLPYIYNAASAFVFPSRYEGFGMPLLQAMACGIPIAASNSASIPEVVGNAALLFDPLDVKQMAEALKNIITDRELRKRLVLAGEERIKEFSWQRCARETLKEIVN